MFCFGLQGGTTYQPLPVPPSLSLLLFWLKLCYLRIPPVTFPLPELLPPFGGGPLACLGPPFLMKNAREGSLAQLGPLEVAPGPGQHLGGGVSSNRSSVGGEQISYGSSSENTPS